MQVYLYSVRVSLCMEWSEKLDEPHKGEYCGEYSVYNHPTFPPGGFYKVISLHQVNYRLVFPLGGFNYIIYTIFITQVE